MEPSAMIDLPEKTWKELICNLNWLLSTCNRQLALERQHRMNVEELFNDWKKKFQPNEPAEGAYMAYIAGSRHLTENMAYSRNLEAILADKVQADKVFRRLLQEMPSCDLKHKNTQLLGELASCQLRIQELESDAKSEKTANSEIEELKKAKDDSIKSLKRESEAFKKSVEAKNAAIGSLQHEIEELKKSSDALQRENEELRKTSDALQREVKDCRRQLDSLRYQREDYKQNLSECTRRLRAREDELYRADLRNQELQGEIVTLQSSLRSKDSWMHPLLTKLTGSIRQLEALFEGKREDVEDRVKRANSAHRKKIAELEARLAGAIQKNEVQREFHEQRMDEVTRQREELTRQLAENEDKVFQLQSHVSCPDAQVKIAALEEANRKLHQRNAEYETCLMRTKKDLAIANQSGADSKKLKYELQELQKNSRQLNKMYEDAMRMTNQNAKTATDWKERYEEQVKKNQKLTQQLKETKEPLLPEISTLRHYVDQLAREIVSLRNGGRVPAFNGYHHPMQFNALIQHVTVFISELEVEQEYISELARDITADLRVQKQLTDTYYLISDSWQQNPPSKDCWDKLDQQMKRLESAVCQYHETQSPRLDSLERVTLQYLIQIAARDEALRDYSRRLTDALKDINYAMRANMGYTGFYMALLAHLYPEMRDFFYSVENTPKMRKEIEAAMGPYTKREKGGHCHEFFLLAYKVFRSCFKSQQLVDDWSKGLLDTEGFLKVREHLRNIMLQNGGEINSEIESEVVSKFLNGNFPVSFEEVPLK